MTITYEIENGKEIRVETYDDGSVYKYDENGKGIYTKDSDGYEDWSDYDERGNEIHFKDNEGYESWFEYDANGNEIHNWDNEGREWFAEDYKKCRRKKSNRWWEFWK